MYARETLYRLGMPDDAPYLTALAQEVGELPPPYDFPVVVAERYGQRLGFVATQLTQEVVAVGPLVVSPLLRMRGLIAVRLLEAYEAILKESGITAYVFTTADHNELHALVSRFGAVPWQQDEDGAQWYLRRLTRKEPPHGWQ
jgi:hypothetical protein